MNINQIEPINHEVENNQYPGELMLHAPQPPLTASTGTLANAVVRIGEIEAALKKLGLIK